MMILLGFVGCSNSDEKETAHVSTGILEYNSIAELDGRRIGILTGSVYDDISMQLAPNGEFAYFKTVSDLVSAIHTNKADAFAIDEYCHKNQIPYTKTYHLQSVFEELCLGILLPEPGELNINFNIEYYQSNGELKMTVLYGGDRFDIHDTKNKLSLSIIEGFVNSMKYDYTDQELANRLVMEIK